MSSVDSRSDVHLTLQRQGQHAQFQARWGPSTRTESGHNLLSLTKQLFAIDNHLQRKHWFSPVESHWADEAYLGQDPCLEVDGTQNELNSAFGEFLSHFALSGCFFFLNLTGILLVYYGFRPCILCVCVSCALIFNSFVF